MKKLSPHHPRPPWNHSRRGLFFSTAFLGLLLLPGPGLSAQELVIPKAYASFEAPGASQFALSGFSARRQLLIDGNLLATRKGQILRGLTLRRSTGTHGTFRGGMVWIEIVISHAARGPLRASPLFKMNAGSDRTRVYRRLLRLSPPPKSPTVPAPWTSPQAVTFAFSTPFRYRGGDLCLEVFTRPMGMSSDRLWWPVDTWVQKPGGVETRFGTSCLGGTDPRPAGVEAATLHLGGTAVFHLRSNVLPPFGLFVLGGSRTRFGLLTLPYPLDRYGAKGCSLYTSWTLLLPTRPRTLQVSRNQIFLADIPIPSFRNLAGRKIYGQWMLFAPRANPLHTRFSNGIEGTVGTPPTDPGVTWIESPLLLGAIGRILRGRVPVMRFVFARK